MMMKEAERGKGRGVRQWECEDYWSESESGREQLRGKGGRKMGLRIRNQIWQISRQKKNWTTTTHARKFRTCLFSSVRQLDVEVLTRGDN